MKGHNIIVFLSNSSLSLKPRLGVDFVFPPSQQSQSQQSQQSPPLKYSTKHQLKASPSPHISLQDYTKPNPTYQTQPTKPNLPNPTYQNKPTKPNLPNPTTHTKLTKPIHCNLIKSKPKLIWSVTSKTQSCYINLTLLILPVNYSGEGDLVRALCIN